MSAVLNISFFGRKNFCELNLSHLTTPSACTLVYAVFYSTSHTEAI